MTAFLREVAWDESGGALVEYVLVGALVSVVSLLALYGIGEALEGYFGSSSSSLAGVAESAR